MKTTTSVLSRAIALLAMAFLTHPTSGATDLSWHATSLDLFGDDIAVAALSDGSFLAADGFEIERSVDAGGTWAKISGFADFPGGAFGIDPTDPSIMYAGRSHGLMKSSDGGLTWFALTDLNAGGSARAIVVAPSEPNVVYAGTPYGWGVYKSRNRGGTWTNILTSRDVTSLVVDPNDSQAVLAGTIAYYENSGGILRTIDGGSSWTTQLTDVNISCLANPSGNGQLVYAGSDAKGIFRSVNGGQTWLPIPSTAAL